MQLFVFCLKTTKCAPEESCLLWWRSYINFMLKRQDLMLQCPHSFGQMNLQDSEVRWTCWIQRSDEPAGFRDQMNLLDSEVRWTCWIQTPGLHISTIGVWIVTDIYCYTYMYKLVSYAEHGSVIHLLVLTLGSSVKGCKIEIQYSLSLILYIRFFHYILKEMSWQKYVFH